MEAIRDTWNKRPLILIIGMAALVRLIAVFWAKGFGMHDDHFLVIEAAQSWIDGTDYNNWLPNDEGTNSPSGHSFFYVGIHYYLFGLLESLGIYHPGTKMLVVRLLHAMWSLVTVWIGYVFIRRYTSLRNARLAGMLLALYWFMPWLSVRNLVEIVAIPFLLIGTYFAAKADEENSPWYWYLSAGLIMGLAFSIRFQSVLFAGGVFLALLIRKRWLGGILAGFGYVLIAALIQGIPDYLIWGKPFVELQEYIRYNMTHAGDYINSPWYTYLLVLMGILIPPISLYLFAGLIAGWKKRLILFLPIMLFLIFHSIFPNKQERFILTIVPFVIIAGFAGWELLGEKWKRIFEGDTLRSAWVFFWIINLLLLPVISTMYSKKARVESMEYLSLYPDIQYIMVDERPRYGIKYPPEFYLGQWISVIERDKAIDLDSLKNKLLDFSPSDYPRFVLFFDDKDLVARVQEIHQLIPGIVFEKRIRPGNVDILMNWLNPNNANQSIFIYRNTAFFPERLTMEEVE